MLKILSPFYKFVDLLHKQENHQFPPILQFQNVLNNTNWPYKISFSFLFVTQKNIKIEGDTIRSSMKNIFYVYLLKKLFCVYIYLIFTAFYVVKKLENYL